MEKPRFGDTLRRILSKWKKPHEAAAAGDFPDVTAEEVKAQREKSAKEHKSKGNYKVEQELVIPNRYHIGEAQLAPIVVTVMSSGGGRGWHMFVTLMPTPEEFSRRDRSQPVFGTAVYDGPPIATKEALAIADEWITDSSSWVPFRQEIPFEKHMAPMAGATMYQVRGY